MWKDFLYAVRMLRAKPTFSLTAVLSLALGIGACTAIFSIVDAVLLRSLPYPNAERIFALNEVGERGNKMRFGQPNLNDLRERQQSFAALAHYGGWTTTVLGGSDPLRKDLAWVSREFLGVLGVQPFLGRDFVADEMRIGGTRAVLVSHTFWQQYLGGKTDLSGTQLRIDNNSYAVIGVLPAGFNFPAKTDLWISCELELPNQSRTAHNWRVIGLLKANVTQASAQTELSAIGRQLRQEHGKGVDLVDLVATPLQAAMVGNVRQTLLIVLAAVGFLLLVACSNVANLLLAQVTGRQKEFAVRAAMGATRGRLLRQLMVENVLLAILAGAVGVLFSVWCLDVLVGLNKENLPRANEIAIDWRVLGFTFGLSLLVAIVLGCVPALRFATEDLRAGLNESGRGVLAHTASKRLRSMFVVMQIALTLMLLISAGLLARSFRTLLQIEPGFQPESAVAMDVSVPAPIPSIADPNPPENRHEKQLALSHQQMLERLRALPGVVAVGGVNALPMTNRGANGQFLIDNNPTKKGYGEYRIASGGYFDALGIRLLRGRVFNDSDGPNAQHVAVITERLARQFFPNEDPLGRTLQFGNMDGYQQLLHIVGIVGDVREYGLDGEAAATIYVHYLQRPRRTADFSVVVRAQVEPAALIPQLHALMKSSQPDVPLEFRTLQQIFASSLNQRRFSLVLFGVFATTALILAIAGIYSMMIYFVTQHTHEIGIRMALGATRRAILRLIVGQGLWLTLIGVGLGLIGAFAVTRLMTSMLFGVTTTDALTFAGAAILLAVIALLACYLPARRATKVDPMIALRCE
ncbi:MAG TPA: ABC transporter permease [Blastocatellia bacterium]|nr:ABC transporter permease [Blastocatellia bacterium]